jgi:MFS transporter, putative metabolite:H+ symporter
MLDFFDFFLFSFVLAFFVRDWHLTFGQSGAILFASGVASIPGGIFFGWLGDKLGRRKVFITSILTFSLATGLMALTPERNWLFMVAMRFIVGLGVAGLPAADLPLLQEFMPAAKRGWISGLSIGLLPLGPLLAAALSASLGTVIGWRGLFAVGLLPALMAFVIRLWVPESPRWLIGRGRYEEARRSLAWALRHDPAGIALPAAPPELREVAWINLFKYPRSLAAAILTGLSQTGAVGTALWGVTLLVLVLKVSPTKASYLSMWIALVGIPGRVFGSSM